MEKQDIATIIVLLNETERLANEYAVIDAFMSNYYEGKAQAFREVLALIGEFE